MSPGVPEVKDNVSLKMTISVRDSMRLKPFRFAKSILLTTGTVCKTPVIFFPNPSGENLPLHGAVGQAVQEAAPQDSRPGGSTQGQAAQGAETAPSGRLRDSRRLKPFRFAKSILLTTGTVGKTPVIFFRKTAGENLPLHGAVAQAAGRSSLDGAVREAPS
jgi:hypothetical protein